jgi:hypothetical protein
VTNIHKARSCVRFIRFPYGRRFVLRRTDMFRAVPCYHKDISLSSRHVVPETLQQHRHKYLHLKLQRTAPHVTAAPAFIPSRQPGLRNHASWACRHPRMSDLVLRNGAEKAAGSDCEDDDRVSRFEARCR